VLFGYTPIGGVMRGEHSNAGGWRPIMAGSRELQACRERGRSRFSMEAAIAAGLAVTRRIDVIRW